MADWYTFLPFLATVTAVAISGIMFMPGEWYKTLDKPGWTPPDWLFGPAWTTLYLMIAFAGWFVWREEGVGLSLGVWSVNLLLNAAWSWQMFGRHRIKHALLVACGMVVTIVCFIWAAAPVSWISACLFVPYLAWTIFATVLNADIARRNPDIQ